MQIVGHTTQQEVYAASRQRPFRINEILLLEDERHNYPLGEVVETQSFNRYIPLATERSELVDRQVLENLAQLGYDIGEETIHLARIRVLAELTSPVAVGVTLRVPEFKELRDLFLPQDPHRGLVLGSSGNEELTASLPGPGPWPSSTGRGRAFCPRRGSLYHGSLDPARISPYRHLRRFRLGEILRPAGPPGGADETAAARPGPGPPL